MSLVALLERYVSDGDAASIEAFVERTRPRLLAAARRIAGADGDDVVQMAYMALLRREEIPRPAPASWLMTVVVRMAYRHVALRRREVAIGDRLARETDTPAAEVDEVFVRRAVDELPPRYRDAVVLRYLVGLETGECARLLDLSEAAVRQRLSRARRLLRSRLSARLTGLVCAVPWRVMDTARGLGLGATTHGKAALVGGLLLLVGVATLPLWRTHAETTGSRQRTDVPGDATPGLAGRGSAGDNVSGITTAVTTPDQAHGVVFDDDGRPVPGVHVLAHQPTPAPIFPAHGAWLDPATAATQRIAVTDARGAFRIANGSRAQSLAFVKAGFAVRASKTPASLSTPVTVVLPRTRRYATVVRDEEGRPIPGARIGVPPVVDEDVGQLGFADRRGRIVLSSLPPETSRASVVAPGYRPKTVAVWDASDVTLVRSAVVLDVAHAANGEPVTAANALLLRDPDDVFVMPAHRVADLPGFPPVPGRLTLSVAASLALVRDGALDGTVHVFADGLAPASIPLRLKRSDPLPSLAVALEPAASQPTIRGRIAGASRATIELRSAKCEGTVDGMPPHLLSTVTTMDGHFAFSVPATRYHLYARAAGCADLRVDVSAPDRDVRLELRPACRLHVRTKPGDWIHAEVDGAPWLFWNAQAGADGIARFDALPAGPARIAPSRHGQWLGAGDLWRIVEHKARVTLTPDALTEADLALPERVAVDVVVRSPRGAPHADAAVSFTTIPGVARQAPGEFSRLLGSRVRTDREGHARLELFPGRYGLRIAVGGRTFDEVLPVSDEGGRHAITLPDGGTVVEGRVADATTGKPLVGHVVWIRSTDGTAVGGHTATDATGSYRVEGVPPGVATLVTRGPAPRPHVQAAYQPSAYGTATRRLTLSDGDRVTADFEVPRIRGPDAVAMPRALRVRVRERDPDAGALLATATLRVLRDDTWIETAWQRCDATGVATLAHFRGDRYELTVYSSRHPPVVRTVREDEDDIEIVLEPPER